MTGYVVLSGLLAVAALVIVVVSLLWSRAKARTRTIEGELEWTKRQAGEHIAARDREIYARDQQIGALGKELERFSPIRDLAQFGVQLTEQIDLGKNELARIQAAIQQANQEHSARQRALVKLEEQESLQDVGFYATRYGLPSSSAYEDRLETVRSHQKAMLQAETAATCDGKWHVDGSYAKGRKMVEEHLKLMLRAFNGECDAAIARVSYKNVETMVTRIERAAETITRLGKSKQCEISSRYTKLKLEELYLMHEYQERLEAERVEQRELRAQMAEEIRAQKEQEKALREAERDEKRYEKALNEAREELENASAQARAQLEAEIADLQQRILETQRKKSMAELTRAGHVYVLSNVGSFGEDVLKIGMTRRLDPWDRVWELSDASVPFDFDVHALIRTEDAPALEAVLHKHFDAMRLNRVNLRREFFRVSLQDVQAAVRQHAPTSDVTFTLAAEAKEWRQSLAMVVPRAAAVQAESGAS